MVKGEGLKYKGGKLSRRLVEQANCKGVLRRILL